MSDGKSTMQPLVLLGVSRILATATHCQIAFHDIYLRSRQDKRLHLLVCQHGEKDNQYGIEEHIESDDNVERIVKNNVGQAVPDLRQGLWGVGIEMVHEKDQAVSPEVVTAQVATTRVPEWSHLVQMFGTTTLVMPLSNVVLALRE